MIRLLALRAMQKILLTRRNAIIAKHLPKDAKKIADFGCGHYANKFANVAVDKASNPDIERGGLSLTTQRAGVQFHDVDLNVFPYPFADKEFDYIICTHVLEHLSDPVRACAEFSRIAKAGYIEVPYLAADVFVRNNDAIHRWLCLQSQTERRISFVDRDQFIRSFPPVPANIGLRYWLQLRNIAYTWEKSVHSSYMTFQ
jgi:ubiquinone/menaquinone biosynthesis C-methylase UbiE